MHVLDADRHRGWRPARMWDAVLALGAVDAFCVLGAGRRAPSSQGKSEVSRRAYWRAPRRERKRSHSTPPSRDYGGVETTVSWRTAACQLPGVIEELRWPHGGHGDCASARAGHGVQRGRRAGDPGCHQRRLRQLQGTSGERRPETGDRSRKQKRLTPKGSKADNLAFCWLHHPLGQWRRWRRRRRSSLAAAATASAATALMTPTAAPLLPLRCRTARPFARRAQRHGNGRLRVRILRSCTSA